MKNEAKKFVTEFREFIAKGNVVDMAVGVIIGGAFGKIVTALVNNVIMPLVSLLTGGINVSDWKWVIKEAVIENGVVVTEETALAYGMFIQSVIDFLIIALCIFIMLKIILVSKDKLIKKKEEEPAPVEPEVKEPTEMDVLCEIRDLLREKQDK